MTDYTTATDTPDEDAPIPAYKIGAKVILRPDVDFASLHRPGYFEALRDQPVVGIITCVTPKISSIFEGSRATGHIYDVDFRDGVRPYCFDDDELAPAPVVNTVYSMKERK